MQYAQIEQPSPIRSSQSTTDNRPSSTRESPDSTERSLIQSSFSERDNVGEDLCTISRQWPCQERRRAGRKGEFEEVRTISDKVRIPPAPIPWKVRPASMRSISFDAPHIADPTKKNTSDPSSLRSKTTSAQNPLFESDCDVTNTGRRPKIWASDPEKGTNAQEAI